MKPPAMTRSIFNRARDTTSPGVTVLTVIDVKQRLVQAKVNGVELPLAAW